MDRAKRLREAAEKCLESRSIEECIGCPYYSLLTGTDKRMECQDAMLTDIIALVDDISGGRPYYTITGNIPLAGITEPEGPIQQEMRKILSGREMQRIFPQGSR